MSGAEGRKNTAAEELQMVHNRIEQCLSNYMTQQEIIKVLYVQHNIDPRFTQLVWEQLEMQNQEFFKEYYLRLKVKEQIIEFNKLLAKQAEMMCRPGSSGIASLAMSNGSKMPSACNSEPVLKSDDIHLKNSSTLSNVFDSGGTSVHPGIQTAVHPGIQTAVDQSSHGRNIDVSGNNFLARDSDGGTCPIRSKVEKPESGFPGYLSYGFDTRTNPMESHPVLCDPHVASFSRIESDSEQLNGTLNNLNGTLVDIDPSLFGYLSQNSPNFGFSDLGAEFTDVPELLGSYSRSSFLSPDTSNFPDTHGLVENQGDVASSSISPENFRCIEHGKN